MRWNSKEITVLCVKKLNNITCVGVLVLVLDAQIIKKYRRKQGMFKGCTNYEYYAVNIHLLLLHKRNN